MVLQTNRKSRDWFSTPFAMRAAALAAGQGADNGRTGGDESSPGEQPRPDRVRESIDFENALSAARSPSGRGARNRPRMRIALPLAFLFRIVPGAIICSPEAGLASHFRGEKPPFHSASVRRAAGSGRARGLGAGRLAACRPRPHVYMTESMALVSPQPTTRPDCSTTTCPASRRTSAWSWLTRSVGTWYSASTRSR